MKHRTLQKLSYFRGLIFGGLNLQLCFKRMITNSHWYCKNTIKFLIVYKNQTISMSIVNYRLDFGDVDGRDLCYVHTRRYTTPHISHKLTARTNTHEIITYRYNIMWHNGATTENTVWRTRMSCFARVVTFNGICALAERNVARAKSLILRKQVQEYGHLVAYHRGQYHGNVKMKRPSRLFAGMACIQWWHVY